MFSQVFIIDPWGSSAGSWWDSKEQWGVSNTLGSVLLWSRMDFKNFHSPHVVSRHQRWGRQLNSGCRTQSTRYWPCWPLTSSVCFEWFALPGVWTCWTASHCVASVVFQCHRLFLNPIKIHQQHENINRTSVQPETDGLYHSSFHFDLWLLLQ